MMGPFFFVQVTSHMFQFKIPEEIHRIDSEARMVHINCVIPSLDYCFFFQDKTTHLWSIGNFLSIRRFHQFLFLFLKDFLLPCIYLTNPQINFVRRDAAKGEINVYIIKLDRRWVRHSKTQKTEPCRIGLVAKFFCSTFWFVLVIIAVTAHGDIIIYTLSSDITFVIST